MQEQSSAALNPVAKPKTIDLQSIAYGVIKGIYRLEGDTLSVCYGFEDRPAAFSNGVESGPVLFVFKRAKPTAHRTPARFPNAEGCEWALFPASIGGSSSMATATRGGLVLDVDH